MADKYRVLTTTLYQIDHAAGFRADDSPKRVVERHQGDEIEFEDNEFNAARIPELLDAGAIEKVEPEASADKPAAPVAKATGT